MIFCQCAILERSNSFIKSWRKSYRKVVLYAFNKYLLSTYNVPGTLLGREAIAVKKKRIIQAVVRFIFWKEGSIKKIKYTLCHMMINAMKKKETAWGNGTNMVCGHLKLGS